MTCERRSIVGGLVLGVTFLVLLWALAAANAGYCWDCSGSCTRTSDCMSGCTCMFPEGDDNQYHGRCA